MRNTADEQAFSSAIVCSSSNLRKSKFSQITEYQGLWNVAWKSDRFQIYFFNYRGTFLCECLGATTLVHKRLFQLDLVGI